MSEKTPLNKKISTTFRHEVIKELLKSTFSNSKNKISEDAIELMVDIAKLMVVEYSARACQQAQMESKSVVTLDHVESILAEMTDKL
ncbi:hypothetical protein ABEB36_003051 [Hypothenemus hampei]|uniref:Centromere protein X n=1 Tax=Hypothenemus hampei TaxID=57062 RepID=A0ABD1F7V6_HYPHA